MKKIILVLLLIINSSLINAQTLTSIDAGFDPTNGFINNNEPF